MAGRSEKTESEKDEATKLPAAPVAGSDTESDTPFDDPKTEVAVDDIVAREGDEILANQDAAAAGDPVQPPHRSFWRSKVVRYLLVLIIVGGLLGAGFWPVSRYYLLNMASVRASSSVLITDELTRQPLKNVKVQLAGVSVFTGSDGQAKLQVVKVGPSVLRVTRPGFETYERAMTVGWGSNPLGTIALKAVGMQYTLQVQDYFTGKGIAGAEVSGGDASALSDKTGKAVLTLAGTQLADLPVQVSRQGYRTESAVAKGLTTAHVTPVSLVTSRKAVFVSKQSGKYDVYSSDADGQNKQVILPGTGTENANISLAASADGTRAALVSTRDDQRSADGTLLNTLSIITVGTGDNVVVAHAEQIRLIDWIGTRLVFEQVSTAASTPANAKYSLIAYDYAANSRLQLAAANKFGTVLTAQNDVYYAISATDADPSAKAGLYKVNTDGAGRQTILEKEVWSTYRTDYNTLAMQTSDGWTAANITTGAITQISAPSAYVSRTYAENPAGTGQSLWVDVRGGQGVLLRYDKQTGKEVEAQTHIGLSNPVRWLTDDAAIFRVVSSSEIADYAASTLGGGAAHKIADVINTYGFTAGQ
ncbi:MAG TPA: hypothetical protein VGO07_07185 [Candidatus Saccharimonadales bacterium]|nr:hypothetical protein [Candidatus Saccharimonadales bacterium]